ncbi:ABC transporter ATP-binding protein (plasmid) [Rhizobium leguminosarum]|uniref:ATP-binding cassette domain-containing protein n=2 Tax=Rhizobium TaxID=379 RepID=A0ABZ1DTS9_9HYPH|nr:MULTISPECIES: ATP-binding cassette domain-containing protein [Rhizobium]ASS59252.1 ABC transporter ATP-binding protein [Rhizobium leguminosarum bv. viciae]AVC47712.1 ABC transporter family protein [Rhizobium leguminosarum bv. viciae]MBA9034590.1 peptide/nickel transport system ATP-binding protein [Rhizobium leguminosarum]MBB4331938.1 peptide/nickel transport system ATP-binding protein [Rhizobium leguminosarum]MBB4345811.1 peptide/nickel transport system ATP-binding protein [Rhizobium legumi
MTDAILALDRVTKTFGHGSGAVHAARAISFSLHAGRALALVGESGSGKTTCARMAMREYLPTSGRILYKGRPVEAAKSAEIARYRRSVQMIFQDPFASLNPAHTIAHHLRRPLKLHRPEIKGAEIDVAVRELLQRVRLDPDLVAPKYPHELSGGQRQRVNIARALAVKPEVIVADEPTSMLDVSVRLGVLNLLNEMKQEMNLGLLYITHDIATARYVAEDIAVMYAGQIVEWGSVAKVIDNPLHPYTRLLLSAVPDPDVRFDDPKARLRPDEVEDIRRRSAVPQDDIVEFEQDHFMRMI